MREITLSDEEIRRIRVASDVTKVDILDCVEADDRIVFVVRKGLIGFALGKNARNLEILRNLFKKNIWFVEFDENEENFIRNLFKPFEVKSVTIERVGNRNVAKVEVKQREKSRIIGKGGKNVQLMRALAKRHSSVDDIQIL
ncbi:MAG: NusA-like transcription termination signal-binding factor [Thermoplasmata archaeon]|nr:NusA-like transcription termination signal-binding factor [Thermoplasmata archaeon]